MSAHDPHDKVVAFKVAISASLSLVPMVIDFVWLIRDEVNYVWSKLCTSWSARMYVLARYMGIASQIYNVYFTVRMYLGVHTSPSGCRNWFLYQAAVVQILLILVEGLLMRLLHVLFLKNRMILCVLISFAVSQVASMGVSAFISVPTNQYTETCLMVKGNPGNAFFSATTLTINTSVFFMMYLRHLRLPLKWKQGHGWIVMRDSAVSLSMIAVSMVFLMLTSLDVIKSSLSGNFTYYWLVCTLWISVGRIIINNLKLTPDSCEHGEGSTWDSSVQFTSRIEMGESTSSVGTQCAAEGQVATSGSLPPSSPMTEASRPSPSPSPSPPSDGSPRRSGGRSPSQTSGRRPRSRASSAEVPIDAPTSRLSRSDAGI